MSRLLGVLSLGMAAGTLVGCATAGTFQTASTVGEDNFQLGVEPSIVGISGSGDLTALTSAGDETGSASGYFPTASISARYGITDTSEIGGRLGPGGLELLTKFQFTDPDSDGAVISLAPSISGFVAGGGGVSGGLVNVVVPLLIGMPSGESNELVLGPKVVDTIVFADDNGSNSRAHIVWVGSTVGYSAQLGDRLKLLPEFGLLYPAVGWASASGDGESDSGSGALGGFVTWQAGLGFLIGQTR